MLAKKPEAGEVRGNRTGRIKQDLMIVIFQGPGKWGCGPLNPHLTGIDLDNISGIHNRRLKRRIKGSEVTKKELSGNWK